VTAAPIEIALWVIGASLITAYGAVRAHADAQRQDGIAVFTQARSATPELPDQSRWSRGRVLAYANRVAAEPDTLPEAVLRIPGVKLAVPVYPDTSEHNLNRGAGLIAGTAQPWAAGNIGIAAHRDGFFRALKNVAVGDRLEIELLSGTRVYRVSALSIVNPSDMRPLRTTDHSIVTLVTCYPFYFVGNAPQRYIVRAVAVVN
jgi:sortase A